LEKFVTSVEDKLQILQEFIQEEMDDVLREYLRHFGQRGVEVYEEVSSVTARSPYHGVLTRRFRGSAGCPQARRRTEIHKQHVTSRSVAE